MPTKKTEKKTETKKKATKKSEKTVKKTEVKKKETKKKLEKKPEKKTEEKPEKKVAKTVEKVKEKTEEVTSDPKEAGNTLIPLNDYVRAGVYIGTKVITPHMRPFIYRRRNDGIAIIDTNKIDSALKEAARFLGDYNKSNVIIVCKREAGWRAVKLFSELTGIRIFTKKYPAGIITNTVLPDFFETELVVVCDPWLDKNALKDTVKMKKKVLGLCDTNNYTFGIDKVIPCNNKSNKSLGTIFYVLAREYMKIHGIKKRLPKVEDFVGEELGDFMKEKKEEKKKITAKKELEKEKSKIDVLMKSVEKAKEKEEIKVKETTEEKKKKEAVKKEIEAAKKKLAEKVKEKKKAEKKDTKKEAEKKDKK